MNKNGIVFERAVEQFNGREGETATLLFGLSVSPHVACGGFAPRHLNRSTAFFLSETAPFTCQNI